MKRRIQAADSIRFCVRGRGAQRLLGQAAQAGLKLERIAPQADGFTAVVSGAGWAKLCQLAGAGGWLGDLTLTPKDPTKLPILLCAVYHRYFT